MMIPLYIQEELGTEYRVIWKLNLMAIYLLLCGWKIGTFIYPPPFNPSGSRHMNKKVIYAERRSE